ncbi:MAG: hypothetical protein HY043_22465 [Verrucomicrobia bacterium]|nr:hypothetical protein [Verrucomicrobiota bacterium]
MLTLVLLSGGCGKEDIRVYRVPKEDSQAVQAVLHDGHDHGGQNNAAAEPSEPTSAPRVRWKLPAGWQEKPGSQMRVGSFAVLKGEQQADISIVPLGGAAGSELANVNRWRTQQLGLEAIDESELSKLVQAVEVGASKARFFELSGTVSQGAEKHPARILAAILARADTTWFFKMIGDDALVREQKPAFVEFLKSISFADPSETVADDGPKRPTPEALRNPAPPASAGKPAWDIPATWKEQPPSQMILASYQATDAAGGKANITISSFPGEAGGSLANVNRWRTQQLGLPAITAAELPTATSSLDVLGGKAMLVDMSGTDQRSARPARLIAASVPRAGKTWFYKLMGDEAVVAREKDAFLKFVQTVRYAE